MGNDNKSKELDAALAMAASSDPWSEDYWDSLFTPLRDFLVNRLWVWYGFFLPYEDVVDAADEIIVRLYQHFDFNQLVGLSPTQRRMRFHGFVKKIIQSVISELLRQKGIWEPDAGEDIPREPPKRVSKEAIGNAFSGLSAEDQLILRYRVIQGLSYREIQACYAQHGIELSVDALKMRALRALRTLRRAVEGLLQGS